MTQQLTSLTLSLSIYNLAVLQYNRGVGACAEDVRRSLEDLSPEGVMIR